MISERKTASSSLIAACTSVDCPAEPACRVVELSKIEIASDGSVIVMFDPPDGEKSHLGIMPT